MDELDAWILANQLRRGEWVALWVPAWGAFIEFNYPGLINGAER